MESNQWLDKNPKVLFWREYAQKNGYVALGYYFFVLQNNIFFIEVLPDSHIFYSYERIIYPQISKSTHVKSIKVVTKEIFLPSFHGIERASLFLGKLVQCYKKELQRAHLIFCLIARSNFNRFLTFVTRKTRNIWKLFAFVNVFADSNCKEDLY